MRAVACVSLVSVCVLTGCSMLGKKSPSKVGGLDRFSSGANAPVAGEGWDRGTPPPAPVTQTAAISGLLAGQVVDSYNRRPPPAYIQVIPADNPRDPTARLEVAADNQGYFTIQGLRPGLSYQLIARAKEGERILAGTTWATPPDPKVLIRISEDFATPSVPPLPPTPGKSVPREGSSPSVAVPPLPPRSWEPARTAPNHPPPPSAELGPPGVSAPGPSRPSDLGGLVPRPEDIATTPRGIVRSDPPVRIPPLAAPSQPQASAPPHVPTRVPSCVLVGRQLHNFALPDLAGQTWEYRNRRGQVVLLDFWYSRCLPCLRAIPQLVRLQRTYGADGLEIVGIAYEPPEPVTEQIRKIEEVRQARQINYTLLLGDRANCPVRAAFGVEAYPTLVLIDENGRIAWQCTGADEGLMHELELRIRKLLRSR